MLAVRRAAESHAIAEGWGRLRVRVDRLASELGALARSADEAEQQKLLGRAVGTEEAEEEDEDEAEITAEAASELLAEAVAEQVAEEAAEEEKAAEA